MLIWSGGKEAVRANWQKSFEKNVAEFDQFHGFVRTKENAQIWSFEKNDKGKKRRARELINSRYIFNCFEYDHSNKPHM